MTAPYISEDSSGCCASCAGSGAEAAQRLHSRFRRSEPSPGVGCAACAPSGAYSVRTYSKPHTCPELLWAEIWERSCIGCTEGRNRRLSSGTLCSLPASTLHRPCTEATDPAQLERDVSTGAGRLGPRAGRGGRRL